MRLVQNVVCKINWLFSVTVWCSGYPCYTRMNIMLHVVGLRCLYSSVRALSEQPKDTIQIIGISASLLVVYTSCQLALVVFIPYLQSNNSVFYVVYFRLSVT